RAVRRERRGRRHGGGRGGGRGAAPPRRLRRLPVVARGVPGRRRDARRERRPPGNHPHAVSARVVGGARPHGRRGGAHRRRVAVLVGPRGDRLYGRRVLPMSAALAAGDVVRTRTGSLRVVTRVFVPVGAARPTYALRPLAQTGRARRSYAETVTLVRTAEL